jgi:tetratricopeptide (TPR) repeat protein
MSEWLRHAIPALVGAGIAYLLSDWLKGWLSKSKDTVYNVSLSSGQKQEISIAKHPGDNPDAAVQMVLLNTITKLRSQDRTPETIKEVERLAQELESQRQTSPLSRRINILLGNAYRYLGQLSSAITVLSQYITNKLRAEQKDHDLADALYNRACYFALSGNPQEALSDLRMSVHLDPENLELARRDPDLELVKDGIAAPPSLKVKMSENS